MTRALRQFFPAAILATFSTWVAAEQPLTASELLERMSSAMNKMSYQGTFVYMRGDSVETMRITHIVDENGVRERLYSIDGPQREIIRDKDGVRCVLADGQTVAEDPLVAGPIYPEIPLGDAHGAEDSPYSLTIGGKARMAGHLARRVSIRPEDGFRYGYELWLEDSTGLLLKWVLFNARRETLARLMFTELRMGGDIHEDELHSTTPAELFQRVDSRTPEGTSDHAEPQWQPARLPPGFRLTSYNRGKNKGQGVFEHLVYSDGLASVSVYIEDQHEDASAAHGLNRIGTASAFSKHVGAKHVTVIGEVPVITVKFIGESVRQLPP